MPHSAFPRARNDGLNIQEAQNELVVYDTRTDKAYVLNPSAVAVWRACNGKRSVRDIAQYLNQTTPTDEQAVYYALGQLNDLLEQPIRNEFVGMSRRQFLKRAGVVAGAAAIPVVVRIVAPPPAHAQSGCVLGQLGDSCTLDSQCCSDCCSNFGVGSPICQVGTVCEF